MKNGLMAGGRQIKKVLQKIELEKKVSMAFIGHKKLRAVIRWAVAAAATAVAR